MENNCLGSASMALSSAAMLEASNAEAKANAAIMRTNINDSRTFSCISPEGYFICKVFEVHWEEEYIVKKHFFKKNVTAENCLVIDYIDTDGDHSRQCYDNYKKAEAIKHIKELLETGKTDFSEY